MKQTLLSAGDLYRQSVYITVALSSVVPYAATLWIKIRQYSDKLSIIMNIKGWSNTVGKMFSTNIVFNN